MSYLVLARKWRPQTFEEVIGQEHVTRTLVNAIKTNRVAHAYLFTGPRGVGKTTTARILARALNCASGPTPAPCGKCDSCRSIAAGSNLDVLEIDGASNRGIEDVRELREQVRYAPSEGRYKVYIIDEVHMLTDPAFNALLKTLEEPPAHVVFIFATTSPQKMPLTILSRCQRFDFGLVPSQKILERLKAIATKEKFAVDEGALALLSRKARGSLRDAESLLDQVISAADGSLDEKAVTALLGIGGSELYFALCDHIVKNDAGATLKEADAAFRSGLDAAEFMNGLIDHLRSLFLLSVDPGLESAIDVPSSEIARYLEQSRRFKGEELLHLMEIASEATGAMRRSEDPRFHAELALARMAELATEEGLMDIVRRLEELEMRVAAGIRAKPDGVEAPVGGGTAGATKTVGGETPGAERAPGVEKASAGGNTAGVEKTQGGEETRGSGRTRRAGRGGPRAEARGFIGEMWGAATAGFDTIGDELAAEVAGVAVADPEITLAHSEETLARSEETLARSNESMAQSQEVVARFEEPLGCFEEHFAQWEEPLAGVTGTVEALETAGTASDAESAIPPMPQDELEKLWHEVVRRVTEKKTYLGSFLAVASPVEVSDNAVFLVFPETCGFHREQVTERANKRLIQEAMEGVFGKFIQLKCLMDVVGAARKRPIRPEIAVATKGHERAAVSIPGGPKANAVAGARAVMLPGSAGAVMLPDGPKAAEESTMSASTMPDAVSVNGASAREMAASSTGPGAFTRDPGGSAREPAASAKHAAASASIGERQSSKTGLESGAGTASGGRVHKRAAGARRSSGAFEDPLRRVMDIFDGQIVKDPDISAISKRDMTRA